jgi:hypothetical protein
MQVFQCISISVNGNYYSAIVFRDDFLGALRKLTRQGDCDPYIHMLQRAHEFSENIFGDNLNEMQEYLKQCNAFSEHTEARLKIIPR